MVNSINFIIVNLFTIMIITPFVNGGLTSRYEFNLNIIFPVFFIVAMVRAFIVTKNFNYKIILVWLSLAGVLLLSILTSLSLSPTNNEVIDIQILSIICGLVCSLPLLDIGLARVINEKSYKYFFFYCLLALIISLGSFELVARGIENSARSIYYASPISIAIIAGFGIIAVTQLKRKYLIRTISILSLLVVMYIMSSRGPIIALFLCCILYVLKNCNFLTKLGGVILITSAAPLIMNIRSTVSESNHEREMILQSAAKLFFNSPFGGYLGRFNTETGLIYSHNLFIDYAMDLGLIQFFCLFIIIVLISIGYFRKDVKCTSFFVVYIFFYLFFCLFFSLPAVEMLKIFIPLSFASLTILASPAENKY